jgi:hypothetical protein
MKQLYWSKVPEKKTLKSVWSFVDTSKVPIVTAEFESLFFLKPKVAVKAKVGEAPAAKLDCIEMNRANNIGKYKQRKQAKFFYSDYVDTF